MDNIILIGFMGAGKTSFGKWYASKNNMQFVDTDVHIEKIQHRSINDIFAKDGEEAFRDMETALIAEYAEKKSSGMVISVGGGLPVRECNRKLFKELGTVIYLRASTDTLCKRLSGDRSRPLLAGGGLREKIEALMAKRKDIYEDCADLIVDTDDKSFEQVEEKIMAMKENRR